MILLLASQIPGQTVGGVNSKPQEQVLFNGQVQVGPGQQYVHQFRTQSNYRNARIAGNVHAIGGSGNDIRVLVLKGNAVVFDSGQRRSVVVSVDFSEPGHYALVFDNGFSTLSPKTVSGRISLAHWGLDQERNLSDQQEYQSRLQQSQRILSKLYSTLKANERNWATTQVTVQPRIALVNDGSINATANWGENTIRVNRGFFGLVDRAGDQGEPVLAAVLAHELGHIFYRHPGYGTGVGLKGFFDELRGVSELDRVQEREADLFAIRLACQAGFDPTGVLVLMRTFAEMERGAGSFMKTHPSGVERYNYLQGQVAECRAWQHAQSQQMTSANDTGIMVSSANVDERVSADSNDPAIWRAVRNPNVRWKFKMGGAYLFGERVLSDQERNAGDFDTVDVKKQGEKFVGRQHVRITYRMPDSSPQGFRLKACQWEFGVELTEVSDDRIEGRWEGYPSDAKVNPATCTWTSSRIWEENAWIRF